jgi:hypothetical protein
LALLSHGRDVDGWQAGVSKMKLVLPNSCCSESAGRISVRSGPRWWRIAERLRWTSQRWI